MESRREDGSTLPNEIVQLIIRAALPPLVFDSFAERRATLLPLLLVNRAWGTLSQTELYRHVGLEDPDRSTRFLACTGGSLQLPLKTMSLHLGSTSVQVRGFQLVAAMLQVLEVTKRVKVIWVTGLRPISLFGLAIAQDLQELYASNVRFLDPMPLPRHPYPSETLPDCLLRNLRHLTVHSSTLGLVDLTSDTVDVSQVPPSSVFPLLFPPLVSVSIFDSHSVLSDLSLSAIDLSPSAAASCETLTIDDRRPPLQGVPSFMKEFTLHWMSLLPHYSALTRLAITEAADLAPLVEALHPAVQLSTLRLIALQQSCRKETPDDELVLALLAQGLPALRSLRRLVLPMAPSAPCRCEDPVPVDGMDLDCEEGAQARTNPFGVLRTKVREACDERNITLVENHWEVDIEARLHHEDWETADSRW